MTRRIPASAESSVARYFYDCEFIEDGVTIDLVSIAVVAEDGREFYAISTEFDPARAGDWVGRNVLDKLPPPSSILWRSRQQIRDGLADFLLAPGLRVELWAWFAAYDHVALAQLWGAMPALPKRIPRLTREIRQHWEAAGSPPIPQHTADRHSALADARLAFARWRVADRVLMANQPDALPTLEK